MNNTSPFSGYTPDAPQLERSNIYGSNRPPRIKVDF